MKVSLNWLHEFVPFTLGPDALAEALTMAGLEIDAIEDRYAFLASVHVGRILDVAPHPNADRLRVCQVDLGDRTAAVVCGAPNAAAGMRVACALPGTVLPDGNTITASSIRGIRSEGMLCSATELELGADSDGIMALDDALPLGQPLNTAMDLSDTVLEIDLTPNRADCLSIIGVAREVAAIEGIQRTVPEWPMPEAEGDIHQETSVTIDAPELCPRYTARLVLDVTVGPSPFWLQDRLRSVGLKPINNIVDVTNFVMMETGQPLHAFDFDRLEEGRIVVKTAGKNATFTTLDGKARKMERDALMICDGRRPVAIGGVMGGLDSEIEPETTRVLIESACFHPTSIRKTAKKVGLGTDASHRFERGVDPAGTVVALNRAAQLITELGQGRLVNGTIDANPIPYAPIPIEMDVDRTNQRLGTDLDGPTMAGLLSSIEFTVAGDGPYQVTPPSHRVDISRFEDLTEEIARLHGYNNIQTTFPSVGGEGAPIPRIQSVRRRVRKQLAGLGFSEAINYSFISEASADRLNLPDSHPDRNVVPILNPLSEDQAVMRTTLLPGMLESIARNLAAQNRTLRLFEIGRTFHATSHEELPIEGETICMVWTGQRRDAAWLGQSETVDFYDLKGAVEALCVNLKSADLQFSATTAADGADAYRPQAAAVITADGTLLGRMGEIAPKALDAFAIKQPVFAAEISLAALADTIVDRYQVQALPKYPATARDLTVIVDSQVAAMEMIRKITGMEEILVTAAEIVTVYDGDPIPDGKKSVTIRITYRSGTETLADATVNPLHQAISQQVLTAFDAALPA